MFKNPIPAGLLAAEKGLYKNAIPAPAKPLFRVPTPLLKYPSVAKVSIETEVKIKNVTVAHIKFYFFHVLFVCDFISGAKLIHGLQE